MLFKTGKSKHEFDITHTNMNSVSTFKQATIGTPVKRHLNGVLLLVNGGGESLLAGCVCFFFVFTYKTKVGIGK